MNRVPPETGGVWTQLNTGGWSALWEPVLRVRGPSLGSA